MIDRTGGVGSPLPPVTLPRLDGGEMHLGDHRGKSLLFMWGSW